MRAISPARRASSSAAARSAAGVAPSGEVKEVDPAGSPRRGAAGCRAWRRAGWAGRPGHPSRRPLRGDERFLARGRERGGEGLLVDRRLVGPGGVEMPPTDLAGAAERRPPSRSRSRPQLPGWPVRRMASCPMRPTARPWGKAKVEAISVSVVVGGAPGLDEGAGIQGSRSGSSPTTRRSYAGSRVSSAWWSPRPGRWPSTRARRSRRGPGGTSAPSRANGSSSPPSEAPGARSRSVRSSPPTTHRRRARPRREVSARRSSRAGWWRTRCGGAPSSLRPRISARPRRP